jgi:hypothetical protein
LSDGWTFGTAARINTISPAPFIFLQAAAKPWMLIYIIGEARTIAPNAAQAKAAWEETIDRRISHFRRFARDRAARSVD